MSLHQSTGAVSKIQLSLLTGLARAISEIVVTELTDEKKDKPEEPVEYDFLDDWVADLDKNNCGCLG